MLFIFSLKRRITNGRFMRDTPTEETRRRGASTPRRPPNAPSSSSVDERTNERRRTAQLYEKKINGYTPAFASHRIASRRVVREYTNANYAFLVVVPFKTDVVCTLTFFWFTNRQNICGFGVDRPTDRSFFFKIKKKCDDSNRCSPVRPSWFSNSHQPVRASNRDDATRRESSG